jgi:hypothetical protein
MSARTDCLKIPDRVLVQLVDSENKPVHLAGVVFEIHLFATRKNDFQLAPFVSDLGGTVTIGAAQMNALVLSEYDSGLMDHVAVEMCSTRIEIRLWSELQVNRALEAREKVWQSLLKESVTSGIRSRISRTSTVPPAISISRFPMKEPLSLIGGMVGNLNMNTGFQ